jgi:hypothetical protein
MRGRTYVPFECSGDTLRDVLSRLDQIILDFAARQLQKSLKVSRGENQ